MDSSRGLIMYRVDIRAFLEGGGKLAFGGSLNIFSLKNLFPGVRLISPGWNR